MNIVIPMAGKGDRMRKAGYEDSKPMIDVLGKPMVQHVVENVWFEDSTYIFIVQASDYQKYDLGNFLPSIIPESSICDIYAVDGITDGAVSSVMCAATVIGTHKPLMIVNSDQVIDWKENPFDDLDGVDGCIYCFKSNHERFSYAKADENGKVIEVAEKKVISEDATAGAYYWSRGEDFVFSAIRMIEANDRVNGEFYNAPVYNYTEHDNVIIRQVNKVNHLGTPEELDEFLGQNK